MSSEDPVYKWYIIQVLSGAEKKVIEQLKKKLDSEEKKSLFEDFFVPEEEQIVVRRGKKVKEFKKIFPGYLLVRMNFSNESWLLLSSIPKVTGFLGDGSVPKVVTDKEVEQIYRRIETSNSASYLASKFNVGDEVNVIDGPFSSFSAIIQSVDVKKEMLSVVVSIFGRQTLLDLRFDQVDKG